MAAFDITVTSFQAVKFNLSLAGKRFNIHKYKRGIRVQTHEAYLLLIIHSYICSDDSSKDLDFFVENEDNSERVYVKTTEKLIKE